MKKRILWTGVLISAIALLVFSFISAELYYKSSLRYTEDDLRAYMERFDAALSQEELTEEYARALSEELFGARVTFLDENGAILADSVEGEEDTRADRPEVVEAMREGEGFDARASQTLREDYSYYCRRFQDGAYYVRIAIPTQSLLDVYLSSFPVVFTFLLLDLAVCLLATYLLTDTVLKPVEKLAMDAARRKRITASCPELETLAALMNRMNDDADRQMKQIADEKELVVKAQQSKNDFIANITHEMNTPLTSIKGFAELLAAGALSGETAQRAAQTILLQSERLTNLVASIINYNEIDSDDLPTYEVNASKVALELLETLAPAIAERHLTLYTHIEPDVLLMSRQERVTEIFGNLIPSSTASSRWISRTAARTAASGWGFPSSKSCAKRQAGGSALRAKWARAPRSPCGFPAERTGQRALFAEKAKNLLILQGADGIMKAARSFRAAFSSPSGRLRGQGARL